MPIGPWRSVAAPLPVGAPPFPPDALHASGRQALSAALAAAGLGRGHLVAIPPWSSACVIGAVGRVATPVPMAAALAATALVDAVLLYDQWGWRRPASAIAALRRRFPRAAIVRDGVDTADLGMGGTPGEDPAVVAHVWSLSKVLGVWSGGVARSRGGWLPASLDEAQRPLAEVLRVAPMSSAADTAKTSVAALPAADERLLRGADLARAFAGERGRRLANLDALRACGLAAAWPAWMAADAGAGDGGPGLAPVLRGESTPVLAAAREAVLAAAGIDAPVYRFDFAADGADPRYQPCLALPLHGEVDPDRIGVVAAALRGFAT